MQSLDFTLTRVLMKLSKLTNNGIINDCITFFDIKLPPEQLIRQAEKLSRTCTRNSNKWCRLLASL